MKETILFNPDPASMNNARSTAHALAVEIFTLTVQFPKYETYSMAQVMRKLAMSVLTNLVKGTTVKEAKDAHLFLMHACASCNAIRSLLKLAKDIGYLTDEQLASALRRSTVITNNLSKEIDSCFRQIMASEKNDKLFGEKDQAQ